MSRLPRDRSHNRAVSVELRSFDHSAGSLARQLRRAAASERGRTSIGRGLASWQRPAPRHPSRRASAQLAGRADRSWDI